MNITFIHLSGKPDQSHHQLISMLDVLLAKIDAKTKIKKLQEEHNLPMTIKLEKEMNEMCNLSSGIREDGFRDGEHKTNIKKHTQSHAYTKLVCRKGNECPRLRYFRISKVFSFVAKLIKYLHIFNAAAKNLRLSFYKKLFLIPVK